MSVVLDSVMTALVSIIDPETHHPITEPNTVNPEDVTIDGPSISMKILLTTAGCPLCNTIVADAKNTLDTLEDVEDVTVEMGTINDEQKKALREKFNGGRPEKEIPFVQPDSFTHVIAVTSGKDEVGKSSMTANLAAAMAKSGLRADVMDADIYDFSVPRILSTTHKPQATDGVVLPSLGAQNMKVVSIDMFVPDDQPAIWCGPMLRRALQQFLADVFWGDLDVLLTDISPDTRDVAISVAQLLPNSQILVITTPQTAAAEIVERAGSIASQMQQRVIGIVENMSYLSQSNSSRLELFGSDGGASVSAHLSVQLGYETPLFAQVPPDIALREGGDVGRPVTLDDGFVSQALSELAEKFSVTGRDLSGRSPGVLPVQE